MSGGAEEDEIYEVNTEAAIKSYELEVNGSILKRVLSLSNVRKFVGIQVSST